MLGLVGESGSGKTTIGRAIAGLTQVTDGSLRVLGQEKARVLELSLPIPDPVAQAGRRAERHRLLLASNTMASPRYFTTCQWRAVALPLFKHPF